MSDKQKKSEALIWVNPNEVKLWDKNPRYNDHVVKHVKASIKQLGFGAPIVIDQNNRVCIGHVRVKAARELKMDKIPAHKMEMTEDQFRAMNIADNKTGELARWDEEKIREIITNSDDQKWMNEVLESISFSEHYLEQLLNREKEDNNRINEENIQFESKYKIIITFKSEEEQRVALEKFIQEGYECQAIIV